MRNVITIGGLAQYNIRDSIIDIYFSAYSSIISLEIKYIVRLYNYLLSCKVKGYLGLMTHFPIWVDSNNYIYLEENDKKYYLNDLEVIIKELMKEGITCSQ